MQEGVESGFRIVLLIKGISQMYLIERSDLEASPDPLIPFSARSEVEKPGLSSPLSRVVRWLSSSYQST